MRVSIEIRSYSGRLDLAWRRKYARRFTFSTTPSKMGNIARIRLVENMGFIIFRCLRCCSPDIGLMSARAVSNSATYPGC